MHSFDYSKTPGATEGMRLLHNLYNSPDCPYPPKQIRLEISIGLLPEDNSEKTTDQEEGP